MKINEKTKISELIRYNNKSIDAIASLAKPFEKLKNPILRKIMASRVTLAEAARMGGVSLADMVGALEPLGFKMEIAGSVDSHHNQPKPEWLRNASQENIQIFDVRPIIDNGSDPLKEILHKFKQTEEGKILCIINRFIPTPLIHLLKQEKAEDAYVETIHEKEFNTFFLKKREVPKATHPADSGVIMVDHKTFETYCSKFPPEKIKVIDVRDLEMPGPMQLILSELESIPAGHLLYIHHKRIPVYLLEELADKNYIIHLNNISEGDVKMTISR